MAHPLVDREYIVTLEFLDTLFGSQPTTNIALAFVKAKQIERLTSEFKSNGHGRAEAAELATARVEASTATLDPEDEGQPLNVTGFASDARGLHLWDYQIKAMVKQVGLTLGLKVPGKTTGTASVGTDIQRLVWPFPVDARLSAGRDVLVPKSIHLRRDGQIITQPDRLFERPLRAQTAQGPRVSIAVSEVLDPPLSATFRLVCLKGCRVTRQQLEDIFSYGIFEGMGQWRGAGWGRYAATIEAA